jgi:undecaprenyl-diphosphatase
MIEEVIASLFFGVLQGITEWLPVSSQGQITIVSQFFGIGLGTVMELVLWLHLGTAFAAIVYFRKEILELFDRERRGLLRFLVIATLFTGVVGAPLYYLVLKAFSFVAGEIIIGIVGVFLIITGVVQKYAKGRERQLDQATTKDAIVAGLFQGFAILPGISRSGTTTAALLFAGFNAESALKLSFLMSIPAVLAANVAFELTEGFAVNSGAIIALLAAFVVGLLTIDIFLKVARRVKFWIFLIILGAISLLPLAAYIL